MTHGSLARSALGVLGMLGMLGCERPSAPPAVKAEFGIFFGGQVQEREELPLVLDRMRQTHGIRLDFREPPERPLRVSWELKKPGPSPTADAGLVEYGEAQARVGEARLEIPLAFRPSDRPGPWHVEVTVGSQKVLERSFRVVPAEAERPASEE